MPVYENIMFANVLSITVHQSGIILRYGLVDQAIVIQIPAGATDVSLLDRLGGSTQPPTQRVLKKATRRHTP
jgi:hypothetical protein